MNRRHAAIARGELQHAAAACRQQIAHLPVRADVGAAEAVNRLLRIADDEELARYVVGEQEQNLGLDGIGVLKFVDEDARELRLEMASHVGVVLDEISRAREEIGEVERAGRSLQRLVA